VAGLGEKRLVCTKCLIACGLGILIVLLAVVAGRRVLSSRGSAQLGQVVYERHCAACHGQNLEGQPNWQTRKADGRLPAPPYDDSGHTWHHSDEQLFEITKFGVSAVVPGYESDMPAFGKKLTDREISAAINFIKSHWSERHRDYQSERSKYQQ
jgi:mono/diheme cytochrome c family protein